MQSSLIIKANKYGMDFKKEVSGMALKIGGACTLCETYTENIVREPNISKDLPLCEECKKEFKQCVECGGHYYPNELREGKCTNCE